MANIEETQMSEKDIQKQLAIYKSSYEMYERSKVDTEKRRKTAKDKNGNRIYTDESLEETLKLMQTMQDDIKEKYLKLGGKEEDLYISPKRGKERGVKRDRLSEIMRKQIEMEMNNEADSNETQTETIMTTAVIDEKPNTENTMDDIDIISLVDKDVPLENKAKFEVKPEMEPKNKTKKAEDTNENVIGLSSANMDITKSSGKNIKYDVIPIPSGGKCYKHKIGKIPVAYLTAYDENMILSPNLYQDGSFLDYLIKEKIMTTQIDTDELLPGDREAILIWLRASGYGPMYPITAKDKETGKEFQTEFDLSKLKYKKFTLVPDENGYFDYTMPKTGDKIKFKFLSYKELKDLSELTVKEDANLKKAKMIEISDSIRYYIEDDNDIDIETKTKLENAANDIEEYGKTLNIEEDTFFNHLVTNRMEKNIVSINGVTDRKYISEYVMYLNILDATSFRKYVRDNEPGVDMNITVERPKSLGGGSVDLFLSIDQYLFLNLPFSDGENS